MADKTIVSGIVERVEGPKANGTYSILVDNTWYGCYKTKPSCNAGDNITFSASQNGNYWNADAKSIKVAATAAVSSKAAPKSTWVPDAARQDAITYQAARKDALEFVNMLHTMGILDLGKAKTGAAKIEVVETYVDKYNQRFFDDTKTLGHKTEAEPVSGKSEEEFADSVPF